MSEGDDQQVSSTTSEEPSIATRIKYEQLVTIIKYNLARISFQPGESSSDNFPNQVTLDARDTWIEELMQWGKQVLLLAQEVSRDDGCQVIHESDIKEAFYQFKRKLDQQVHFSPASPNNQ